MIRLNDIWRMNPVLALAKAGLSDCRRCRQIWLQGLALSKLTCAAKVFDVLSASVSAGLLLFQALSGEPVHPSTILLSSLSICMATISFAAIAVAISDTFGKISCFVGIGICILQLGSLHAFLLWTDNATSVPFLYVVNGHVLMVLQTPMMACSLPAGTVVSGCKWGVFFLMPLILLFVRNSVLAKHIVSKASGRSSLTARVGYYSGFPAFLGAAYCVLLCVTAGVIIRRLWPVLRICRSVARSLYRSMCGPYDDEDSVTDDGADIDAELVNELSMLGRVNVKRLCGSHDSEVLDSGY